MKPLRPILAVVEHHAQFSASRKDEFEGAWTKTRSPGSKKLAVAFRTFLTRCFERPKTHPDLRAIPRSRS